MASYAALQRAVVIPPPYFFCATFKSDLVITGNFRANFLRARKKVNKFVDQNQTKTPAPL